MHIQRTQHFTDLFLLPVPSYAQDMSTLRFHGVKDFQPEIHLIGKNRCAFKSVFIFSEIIVDQIIENQVDQL